MASFWDLDTPAAVVDLDRVERNLERMAEYCREAQVNLRPHTKSHKTPELARMQVAHGARGITVAKVGEAEVMSQAGFDDLFIAYPVLGEGKYRRLLEVMNNAQVRIGLDSYEVARAASDFFAAHGRRLPVLIEVDSGFGRCGVQSLAEAEQLADRIGDLKGVELVGVMGFGGHSYAQPTLAGQMMVGRAEGEQAADVATSLRARGHSGVQTVSVGSTPSSPHAARVSGVTEVRPGVYIFYDRKQVSVGVATLNDCALTVLATVVSHPTADRWVLDAGIKALAGEDYGWREGGQLLDYPDLVISQTSEEHGVVRLPEGAADPGWRIGDKVRIVPNHACGTANMHEVLFAVRGESVEAAWAVAGRAKFR